MINHFAVKCKSQSQKINFKKKSSTSNQDTCIYYITGNWRSSVKRFREQTKDSKLPECRCSCKYQAHKNTVCPARGKECYTFHRLNHFSSQCKRRYSKQSEHVAVKNRKRLGNSGRGEHDSKADHRKIPPHQDIERMGDITETQEPVMKDCRFNTENIIVTIQMNGFADCVGKDSDIYIYIGLYACIT
ncbi:hypothetical protein BgiBS90_028500 [Biomphalaria glabrata]|nr:hypothetical protein BgiBS90_028500 [Biomphalaria glabrata]